MVIYVGNIRAHLFVPYYGEGKHGGPGFMTHLNHPHMGPPKLH